MLEELTPQLLSISMLVIALCAPPLTLLLSALLLWRYRRAVLRAMAASAARLPAAGAGAGVPAAGLPPSTGSASAAAGSAIAAALADRLQRGPRRAALRLCGAGLAYALTITLAVAIAFEPMRTLPRLLLVLWAALWPLVPALALTAPAALRTGTLALLAYLAPLFVILALAWLAPSAPQSVVGGEAVALRADWSPPEMLRVWFVVDGVPTLLLLLFLNRWTRAVGPLVLALVSVVLAACVVVFLTVATRRGMGALALLMELTTLPPVAALAATLLLTAALGTAVGALWLQRVRSSYLRKTLNDRSLTLDALWLVVATFHGMLFALVGLAWVSVGPLAWLAYRVSGGLAAARGGAAAAQGLVFLRVFALGRRSERLFDALARQWRHVGSVQLITGPDLAHSTVAPHQLLDFMSGRLASHFIADDVSLAQRIDSCDRRADRDGLYRVNSLFCHADTWEAALVRLVGQGDVVLMDLRAFGEGNAGCIAELRHLVQQVPLARCVWVVDRSTDQAFLQRTLHGLWQQLAPTSPNRGSAAGAAPLHRLQAGRPGLQRLVARLSEAAAHAAGPAALASPPSAPRSES